MQRIDMTVKRFYCLYVVIHFKQLAVVTAQDSNINPSLTISPAIVTEDNSQTLTCKYSGSQSVSDMVWKLNNSQKGSFSGSCTVLLSPDETLYSYTCDVSSNTFTFTIKNVRRNNRYDKWQCHVKVPAVSAFFLSSNDVNPKVKVLISSVSMTLPLTSQVTIKENTPQQFQCVTSGGLPEPKVKWYQHKIGAGSDVELTSSIVTSYSNTTDGLDVTTSTLTFVPTKNDHKRSIYCSAFVVDQTPKQSTKKPELNVLYGPDSALTIQGFTDGASYLVIENTPGHLTCLIRGGNPLPTLRWSCYNADTSNTSVADTVSMTVRWKVGRGQDRECQCFSTHFSRNESTYVQVDILYPPTTPVFYVQSTKVSGKVKVIRNKSVSINCSSSGKPNLIQYTWIPSYSSSSGSVLNINRVYNDSEYTCNVQNEMDPSDDPSNGDAKPGNNSSLVQVEVLYPPSSPSFRYWNISGQLIHTSSLNVIQDDTLKVACTSEGKPNPDSYQWDTRGNNQLLTVSSIPADQTDHKYKCTVKNSMYETVPVGKNPTRGSATSTLTVHVMYPPSSPTLHYQYGQEPMKLFTGSFKKIEGNAERVTVICNSSSEPQPTFSWNGPLTSNSATLTLANIDRSKAGTYSCSVENKMKRTFGNPETVVRGRINGNFNLQILYPPVVDDLMNRSVVEGDSLAVFCPVKVGNPPETSFKWTNSSGSQEWKDRTLTINKVSRNDAKFFYICEVENEMHETGKQQIVKIPDSKSFHLNVWYAATIEDFYITGFSGKTNVTVNESGTVYFKCNVDSNPGSNITVQNQTKGTYLATGTNSKSLEYELNTVTCFDAGLYTCAGSNGYKPRSEKQLHLFVNCSPRPSPFIQLTGNVTSAQHVIAVLAFSGFAYPKPTADDFQWFIWNISQWTPLSNDDAYMIDTGNLQSNLTVKNVSRSSYGKYKLTVKNTIGDYDQMYHLLPEDKPDVPTDFEHVQELVTETSFTVQWKPGFDNGLDQVFILKYRKVSDHLWNIVNITDTGRTQMSYKVSGLSSGTTYQAAIYASNKLGNSSELEIATMTTKARKDPPGIGPLVGGAVGGSVSLVLFVVLGFLLIRKFRLTKGKGTSEVELNRRQMDDHDDESSEDEVITENAMYVSAGGVVKKNFVDDNVYAKPQKKVKTNQDVYAVVNKGKIAGQKKKQKKSKSPKQDTGDIYENAPVSANKDKTYANGAYEDSPYEDANTASTSKHVKKNADGLIYADLAFNDQPKGQKKLVIHGLDSMTEYVEVDFTKKADPLPDSDTEDQK